VHILNTLKNMTQPVPGYSIFRLMREMNSPELQKVFGFMITFIKHFSQPNKMSNN